MRLLIDLIVLIYLLPLWMSVFYFTLLRLEDIGKKKEDRAYSPDKFPYWKVMLLCLIPLLNILFMVVIFYRCFKYLREGFNGQSGTTGITKDQ